MCKCVSALWTIPYIFICMASSWELATWFVEVFSPCDTLFLFFFFIFWRASFARSDMHKYLFFFLSIYLFIIVISFVFQFLFCFYSCSHFGYLTYLLTTLFRRAALTLYITSSRGHRQIQNDWEPTNSFYFLALVIISDMFQTIGFLTFRIYHRQYV